MGGGDIAMTNKYRNLLPLLIHTEDGAYGQGEIFEKDFSEDDERANVESGLLEIVPRRYKVVGESVVHGAAPGETFEAGLLLGNEAQLIASGNIQRVGGPPPELDSEPESVKPKPTKKAAAKRSANPKE
jgi:hypothetical protein